MSGAVCDFDPETHTYRINGQRAASVTEVLKPWYRGADRFTEEGRERGRLVHLAVQLWLERDLDEDTLDPRLAGYVAAVRRLDAAIGLRRPKAAIERPRYSEVLRFAGTPDWTDEGSTAEALPDSIIDWKSGSGSIDPVTALQLAGYEVLIARRCRRFGVSLRANGTFKLVEFTDRTDRAQFLNALALHHRFITPTRPVGVAREEYPHAAIG